MPNTPPDYQLTNQQLRARVWSRLRRYRGTLALSLGLLLLSVPFVNFHPLVWGFVADQLVEKTLTPSLLLLWLGIMLATYLVGPRHALAAAVGGDAAVHGMGHK